MLASRCRPQSVLRSTTHFKQRLAIFNPQRTRRAFASSSANGPAASPANAQNLAVFSSLTNELDRIAPRFEVDADDIDVLKEPSEFYEVLKDKISKAKRRIYISTLYVGKTEHELIQCLHTALSNNPDLHLSILTDYLRGTRESPKTSCASLLAPLTAAFPGRVELRMFHTPNLAGLKKAVLPTRINEGWGLQHMKLYGVDDELLLSGANLSSDYFTNRQDRYLLFRSAPLAAFYERAHRAVCALSFSVTFSDAEKGFEAIWPAEDGCPDPLHDGRGYIAHASKLLAPLLRPTTSTPSVPIPPATKTVLYPLFQFAPLLPRNPSPADPQSTELPALRTLLTALSRAPFAPARWTFTAGYFNMTPGVRDMLLSSLQADRSKDGRGEPKAHGTVLTAHPHANGFFGSPGVSGLLPPAYTLLARRFLSSALARGVGAQLTLREWRRGIVGTPAGWTYHAKGLWVHLPSLSSTQSSTVEDSEVGKDGGPCVTLVGSSNYTARSHTLDLEANALLVTADAGLRARLAAEEAHLLAHAGGPVGLDTFAAPERRVGLVVRVALWIVGVVGGAL